MYVWGSQLPKYWLYKYVWGTRGSPPKYGNQKAIYILVTGIITFHTKTLKPKEKKSSYAIVSHFHMSYIWAWLIWTNVRKIEASLNTRHCLHVWTKVCPLFPRLLINPWTEFWHPLRLLMSFRLRQLCPIPRDGRQTGSANTPACINNIPIPSLLSFLIDCILNFWQQYKCYGGNISTF